MKSIKIVVIGAGSREFSRGLIHDIVLAERLHQSCSTEVVLVDINESALNTVLGYAKRCAASLGAGNIAFSSSTDREKSLHSADFVLISIAINRMDLWEQDFRVPFAYGIKHVYGENGGPGALFHALRNFKMLSPICSDIERICPDAFVLNFTNPEARVLTLIRTTTNLKAFGLCHGFYSFRTLASDVLEMPEDTLDIRTAGMNHFYTFYKIAAKESGRDLIPEFTRRLDDDLDRLEPLARYFWSRFGAMGYSSDLHIGEYIPFANEFTENRWAFGVENRTVPSFYGHVDNRTTFDAWRFDMKIEEFLKSGISEKEEFEMTDESGFRADGVKPSGELAVPIILDIVLNRKMWRPAVNTLNTENYISGLSA
ncbi:MAG: hypothetical protein HN368_21415, partial [Spirochaetales bacterium]|nr:hypothetical protein [Spirochaetales bacterium]